MQFRTSTLFVIATFFAIVAWTFIGESIARSVVAPFIIGILVSLQFRDSRPLTSAAFAGAFFVAICVFLFWLMQLWGYLHHDGSFPYYEDGFVSEVIAYPIVFCILYCPIAAAASTIAGGLALACVHALKGR